MKTYIILISIMLISCNAKNSNVAVSASVQEEVSYQPSVSDDEFDRLYSDDAIVEEKEISEVPQVASLCGGIKAEKLQDNLFKVTKKISAKDFEALYEDLNGATTCYLKRNDYEVVGIADASGKWIVPARYHDVEVLGRGAYKCLYKMTECYVSCFFYKGKECGSYFYDGDVTLVTYKNELRGFLKHVGGEYFYIDVKGQEVGEMSMGYIGWTIPHYTACKIEDDILVLWGDGAFDAGTEEEMRQICKVDVRTNKVIYDPFEPSR